MPRIRKPWQIAAMSIIGLYALAKLHADWQTLGQHLGRPEGLGYATGTLLLGASGLLLVIRGLYECLRKWRPPQS